MKRTQQRRRGARTLRLLLFCSIADVVPPLAGLRSGSRPAGTLIVLVEEVCIAFFSRVFSLSSLLCVPVRWSFQEEASEMQSHTRLVCRAERVHCCSFRSCGPSISFFSSIFPFQECEDQKKTKFSSFFAFRTSSFSFEEKTCVSRSVRLSFKLVIRARC